MLYEVITRGADQAILLTDKKFAGADTLATSSLLVEGFSLGRTLECDARLEKDRNNFV